MTNTKEKLQKAAAMNADEILFKNISKLIEYRKQVAIDMLKCQDEEAFENLSNLYERSEWHLKELLGIS